MSKTYTIDDPPELLENGDEVVFNVPAEYSEMRGIVIGGSYITVFEEPFSRLGMRSPEKKSLARQAYGYAPGDGRWPECKSGDMEALTRLVNALYEKIREITPKEDEDEDEDEDKDKDEDQAGKYAWYDEECAIRSTPKPATITTTKLEEQEMAMETGATMHEVVMRMIEGEVKKTLKVKPEEVAVAEIVHHGTALTLPEGMTLDQAIKLLERRKEYMTEKVSLNETFDVFPWDGAHALDKVLTRRYGWTPAEGTESFFGKQPPKMIQIEVGVGVVESVPWGAFSIPGIKGRLMTGVNKKGSRYVFAMQAEVLRADEEAIKELFADVREYLKTGSIYQGKAIKIRFLDDDGDALEMPEPKFLDTAIDPHAIIFNKDVASAIQTSLFTPIQRVADCHANGIPVKRGVLLGGTYGTGKTLAAKVASQLAVQNGVTYIYVPRADELALALEFAKQYHDPACVVFCEDIDRVMDGARSVAMDDILNIIDGIDTKTNNIIVVLTTNALSSINPAMLRPGRLDAVIKIPPPDAEAVEKLIRLYGGASIADDTNLALVGKDMAGSIPAVIAEMVKRAKLAQLSRTPLGGIVTTLSEDALMEAAFTMKTQLHLLAMNGQPEPALPPLEGIFTSMMKDAAACAFAGHMNGKKKKDEDDD